MKSEGSIFSQAVRHYATWVITHPYLVLALSLFFIIALGSGATRLGYSKDYRIYFGPENPYLLDFKKFQNTYGNGDSTYITISMKDRKPGSAFTPEVLSAARDFTHEAWKLPYSIRVDSLTNYQYTSASGDDLLVEGLLPDAAEITPERIVYIREVVMHDPELLNYMVTASGDVLSIKVTTEMPMASMQELPAHVSAVRALRERIAVAHPMVEIHMTGSNMMSNAFTEAGQHDGKTLIPLTYLLIIVITYLMLRSGLVTLSTVIVLIGSCVVALGAAGYMNIMLTPPSMLSPLAITTLAVADSVHVAVTAFALMRNGISKDDAIVDAISSNFGPIALTGLTTAIGFLTMNMVDSPPLRDLGNITALGVVVASIFSVFLLPALFKVFPIKPPKTRKSLLENLMVKLGDTVIAYPRTIFLATLVVSVVLSLGMLRNHAADNYNNYFDDSVEFSVDNRFIINNVTDSFFVDFSLDSNQPEGITDPAVLAKIEAFAEWWRQQPNVSYVGSITDVFKRLNKSMHGDDQGWYVLPESQPLASQYLLLYEMSLPFGLDLANQISMDKSSTRVRVYIDADHIKDFIERVEAGKIWLSQNAPEIKAYATSPSVLFSQISERNISSMLPQAVTMFLIMSLTLIFTLRSIQFGLLSLVTLSFPVAISFGIWGYLSGEINFTMAVLIGLVTGICDDDTVHFLNDYLRLRREQGLSAADALRETFRHTGVALLVTTAVLVSGFLVMAQSAFLPNSGMAQLAYMSFSAALLLNLLLLPSLILLLDRSTTQTTDSPVVT